VTACQRGSGGEGVPEGREGLRRWGAV
jgi:hypothetical protein